MTLTELRELAEAYAGTCHRCAFLRQQHQPDMGHEPGSMLGVRAETLLALVAVAEATRVVTHEKAVGTEEGLTRAIFESRLALNDLEAALRDR